MSQAGGTGARSPGGGAAAEFERLYRANVEAVTAYFARRTTDPHTVADLTAAGVVAGTLVTAGGPAPAYAVTENPDGTVSLAVYQPSGYAGANARLHQMGVGKVVVVPVRPGCPAPPLRKPRVSGRGHLISERGTVSASGKVTVRARGIPAGDIMVVGIERTGHGSFAFSALTSPPAPSCISLPHLPPTR